MSRTTSVKVDAKGRLSIPRELRDELDIQPGDPLFVEREEGRAVLRYAVAENPFDALAQHAEDEYRAGRTRGLHAFAADEGISLDEQ